jgi:hypothetical protein
MLETGPFRSESPVPDVYQDIVELSSLSLYAVIPLEPAALAQSARGGEHVGRRDLLQ